MSYNETCSVCIEDFIHHEQTTTLGCGHKFHVACIIKCLRKSNECPNCRDTDGNPISKIQSEGNTLFNWDWDSDTNASEDDEYVDFLDCMKGLLKDNKELAGKVKDYKRECKLFGRKCDEIEKSYDKDWSKFTNEFLNNFKTGEEYKNYVEDKTHFCRMKGSLKRQLKLEFEKKMDIPRDANGEFVDKYLEDMFDRFIFEPFIF